MYGRRLKDSMSIYHFENDRPPFERSGSQQLLFAPTYQPGGSNLLTITESMTCSEMVWSRANSFAKQQAVSKQESIVTTHTYTNRLQTPRLQAICAPHMMLVTCCDMLVEARCSSRPAAAGIVFAEPI